MSRAVWPQCGRKVVPEHFACRSGAKGGRVGGKATGTAKRRGDSAHYRAMVARRKDRKANAPLERSPRSDDTLGGVVGTLDRGSP